MPKGNGKRNQVQAHGVKEGRSKEAGRKRQTAHTREGARKNYSKMILHTAIKNSKVGRLA